MQKALKIISVVIILTITTVVFLDLAAYNAPRENWVQVSAMPVDGQPSLVETVWETHRSPHAKYDTIGVRRLKSDSSSPALGVVFFIPSSVTSARLYTSDENHDFRIFLANRGYEIYSFDYRASFIPPEERDLSSMATWDTRLFLDDIQAAVTLAKQESGFSKVFIAGHSTGARYVYLYGALRWREDIAGLIPLDGAPWESYGPEGKPYSLNIDDVKLALSEGDTPENRALFNYWQVPPGPGYYEVGGALAFDPEFPEAVNIYYTKGPESPSPVQGFDNVNDYIASQFQNLWGPGQFSNPLEGYAKVDMLLAFGTKASDAYWPMADYLDDAYIGNWNGKPPKAEYNYMNQLQAIDVPVIAFASGGWGGGEGMGAFEGWWREMGTVIVKSTDTEYHLLNGFGHIDVLIGEKAKDQVYMPLLDWLNRHPQSN